MDRLYAPWRSKYIMAPEGHDGCILCNAYKAENDRKYYILHRGKYAFVIMNIYPYNNGHLMVVPYLHVNKIEDLPEKVSLEIFSLIQKSVIVLKKAYNPDGFNIGMNLGRVAGAGIKDHLHTHIVPRWNGDTNFMPVLGDTKILSIDIDSVYDKLLPLFKENENG